MSNLVVCSKCQTPLEANNWLPSRRKRSQFICRDCIRTDNNQRYQKRKEKYLQNYKDTRLAVKLEIFSYYGGICQICEESDFSKLSLDHTDGYGRQHRKEVLGIDSGSCFYKWVLKNKPDNIRLLCFNCNCQVDMTKKELLLAYNVGCKCCGNGNIYRSGVCSQCFQIIKRNNYIDLKIEVFEHYGSKCACCEEDTLEYLTIDHINNDGATHRKEIGTQIFPWLKSNNYPNNFQILCFNCNYVKRNDAINH
jgi:hypothetical protein